MQAQPQPPVETTGKSSPQTLDARRKRWEHGIDTGPVDSRLRGLATIPPKPGGSDDGAHTWADVLSKIHASPFMRKPVNRAAGQRRIAELVDVSGADTGKPYVIDDAGILRRRREKPEATAQTPTVDKAALAAFLEGRRIGGKGNKLHWFSPVPRTDRQFVVPNPASGEPTYKRVTRTAYRQGVRLTAEEAATFRAFPKSAQDEAHPNWTDPDSN